MMRVAMAVDCRLSHGCYEQGYGQDRSQYIVKWSVKNCLSFLTRFKVLFTERNRLKQCTNGVSRQVMKSPVSPVI